MIYLDTSAGLAHLLGESQVPPASIWKESLVSSRLLEYELWTRIHARGLTRSHAEPVRELLSVVALVELSPTVLMRALAPFPVPVRTLDALHLASMVYLKDQLGPLRLLSYDERLVRAARALGIGIFAS